MKKTALVAVVAVMALAITNPVAAQQVRDQTRITYDVLTSEWSNLIEGTMDLTEEQAADFWPIYKEYGAKKGELWNKRIDVLKMYMRSYGKMTPETARILLDQSFSIDKQMLELEMEYAKIFDDVLPPNKVVRLFQAENKLETTMLMELAKDVPLAK